MPPKKDQTANLQKCLDAINAFYDKNGYFPSTQEIIKDVKLGRTMIYNHIQKLEELGNIERNKYNRIIATSPLL